MGGREKNKHAGKRGKTANTAVAGIRDRKTGRVATSPVPETAAARTGIFTGPHAEPGAMAYAD